MTRRELLALAAVVLVALGITAALVDAALTRVANSTAYCLRGTMADGTPVRAGSVAMNRHPLGTRITLVGASFNGRRRFVVRDRIGHGSELDIWTASCSTAIRWGRRTVRYRLGHGR